MEAMSKYNMVWYFLLFVLVTMFVVIEYDIILYVVQIQLRNAIYCTLHTILH